MPAFFHLCLLRGRSEVQKIHVSISDDRQLIWEYTEGGFRSWKKKKIFERNQENAPLLHRPVSENEIICGARKLFKMLTCVSGLEYLPES